MFLSDTKGSMMEKDVATMPNLTKKRHGDRGEQRAPRVAELREHAVRAEICMAEACERIAPMMRRNFAEAQAALEAGDIDRARQFIIDGQVLEVALAYLRAGQMPPDWNAYLPAVAMPDIPDPFAKAVGPYDD
jgi:hypothetical protein